MADDFGFAAGVAFSAEAIAFEERQRQAAVRKIPLETWLFLSDLVMMKSPQRFPFVGE